MKKTTDHRIVTRVVHGYPHTVGWAIVCLAMLFFLMVMKGVLI